MKLPVGNVVEQSGQLHYFKVGAGRSRGQGAGYLPHPPDVRPVVAGAFSFEFLFDKSGRSGDNR